MTTVFVTYALLQILNVSKFVRLSLSVVVKVRLRCMHRIICSKLTYHHLQVFGHVLTSGHWVGATLVFAGAFCYAFGGESSQPKTKDD
jgi:hypothetical protein